MDPEVRDVNVAGALTSGGPTVALEFLGTLIILFKVTCGGRIALGGQKIHAPNCQHDASAEKKAPNDNKRY